MSRFPGLSARLASRLRILGYSRNGRPDVGRFCRERGYRRQYVYAWLAGRVPGPEYIRRLARDLDVSANWLMLGAAEEAVVALHGAPPPGRPRAPRGTSGSPARAQEDRAPGGKAPIVDFQKLRDLRDLAAKLVHTEADLRAAVTLLAGEKQVLEMIATGAPVHRVLDTLCRTIEEESDGMLCSVLLLDADGARLRHGAAPSLPEEYVRAIDGLPIGPSAGSCGTAAHRKATVIVSDIATDPLWTLYRELGVHHGFRACWSTPVLSTDGTLLGTFAMYYHTPREPNQRELRLIDRARNIAGIAVGRTRMEAALRESAELFRTLAASSPVVIFMTNAEGRTTYVNPRWRAISGQTTEQSLGLGWMAALHPADREAVAAAWLGCVRERRDFSYEFRVEAPGGGLRWVHGRGSPMLSDTGDLLGYVGTAEDITERKKAEETTRALAEVGRALSQSLDPAIVGQRITRSVRELFDADNSVLFRLELETGRLVQLSECLKSGSTPTPKLVLPRGIGVAGLAIREGRAVATSDVLADPRVTFTPDARRWVEQGGYRAVLAMPLIATGSTIGALALSHRESRTFAGEDIRLLEAFADQAAIALQNALLLEEAERRRQAAESLAEVARLLSETLDPGVVAQRIVECVRTLLGIESASVFRVEPDSGDLATLAVSSDFTPLHGSRFVLPRGAGTAGLAVREGRTVSTPNLLADPRIEMPPDLAARVARERYWAVLAVPLAVRGRIIGVLCGRAEEGRAFGAAEVALAESFAGQAAVALENARLFEENQARLAAGAPPARDT